MNVRQPFYIRLNTLNMHASFLCVVAQFESCARKVDSTNNDKTTLYRGNYFNALNIKALNSMKILRIEPK